MATLTKSSDKPVKTKPAQAAKPTVAAKAKTTASKPAAAKSKAEKTPAKPATATSAKPVKAPAVTAKKTGKSSNVRRALAPDQRRYYVEVAAYYIAEQRGFHGDSQLNDWVAAEAEIDRLLREGILNP